MDFPADLLPIHSCAHCKKFILDPNTYGQPDSQNSHRSWKAFDPELTIGKLGELGQHGCLFGKSLFAGLKRYKSVPDYSPVLYSFIPWEFDYTRYRGLRLGIPEPPDDDDESKPDRDYDYQDGQNELRSSSVKVYRGFSRDLMTTSDNTAFKIIPRRPINLEPGSKSSFDLARGWFQTCLADHVKCPKPRLNFMPKRVIGINQNQSGFTLRLLETEGLRDLYCALSYCWGGDQKTKATKETLSQLKANIAFDKLPATLQDAITTTHGLGLHYLFVDSLCILQDDEEDMHRQIAQMSEIYSEAAITILASRACSVDFGFLHKRRDSLPDPPSRNSLFKMSLRCPDGELGSVVVLAGETNSKIVPALSFRAWAFQENLLSARTLGYEEHHTTWRCPSVSNLTDGWLITSNFFQIAPLESVPEVLHPHSAIKATKKTEHCDERQEIFEQWHSLVREYVRLKLSFPSDKLPAISAIAERMGSALGDEYLAGIWKSRLPLDLLWESWRSFARPKEFRAPSWSWAAVDIDAYEVATWLESNIVSLELQKRGLYQTNQANNGLFSLEVLECHTELESPAAPYGAVRGGHLVVRGRLRRVVLSGIRDRAYASGKFKPATIELFKNVFHIMEPGLGGDEAWIPMNFDAVEQEFRDSTNMDIAMLEVCAYESGYIYGLVLREVGHQKFSRLGLYGRGYGPERLDSYSSPVSDPDEWLERDEEWEPSFNNWLRGFEGCDLTTLTLV